MCNIQFILCNNPAKYVLLSHFADGEAEAQRREAASGSRRPPAQPGRVDPPGFLFQKVLCRLSSQFLILLFTLLQNVQAGLDLSII